MSGHCLHIVVFVDTCVFDLVSMATFSSALSSIFLEGFTELCISLFSALTYIYPLVANALTSFFLDILEKFISEDFGK